MEKKKLGGKSFKFSGTLSENKNPPPALTGDKQSIEFIVSMILAHTLHYNGVKISKIEVNEDDSNKQPDTIICAGGKDYGVQVTKLSLNDPLTRINASERKTREILELISANIDIPKPINVYIYLAAGSKNELPVGRIKKKKKLAEFIENKIIENKDTLFNDRPDFLSFSLKGTGLEKIATIITINPVNPGHFSPFPGRNGIHINYEFDCHEWSEEDLKNAIERMIKRKEGGKEDVLLIWGDRFEMLYQYDEITNYMIDKFSETSFKHVFFICLDNRIDMFMGSWKVRRIK